MRRRTKAECQAFVLEQQKAQRAAVRAFVETVHAGDAQRFVTILAALDITQAWIPAMRAVAKAPAQSEEFRRRFLAFWEHDGGHLRSVVNDDLVLLDGLRSLLPPYIGGSLTLYRGDSSFNRRRRTYGLSWSASLDIARRFATDTWRNSEGGSVLLRAEAPPEAIVCAPSLHGDEFGEDEYIVDRRQLRSVQMLERLPHLSTEEHHKITGQTMNSLKSWTVI